ncbi:OmpA family protein [Oculatella sp. LEGE 06141]|uniref:OmpA family protein n=1 Tax=Oculatella sp. LEGE 06141 TaxID=1828648 RepID=UPI001881C34F|nr:OmpA family protein [Oculatella sp. LEGE 06141]MBE9179677.1 OmpA family protein [Oculatella sp. LEGE 06141]
MTHSSATHTPEQQTVELSSGRLRSWLVFIFRLLLLGVSGGFAVLLGIAIAQFFPAQVQNPPFLERTLLQSDRLINSVRRWPQPWRAAPSPVPSPEVAPAASPSVSVPPAPPLNDTERQRLQSELSRLEGDLDTLSDRAAALESRLGTSRSTAALEARIQVLQQQLDPNAANASPDPAAGVVNPTPVIPAPTDLSDTLMVTLPSDALFDANSAELRPGSQAILDSIISDLRRYPGATIRIAAFTDTEPEAESNGAVDRVRSFEQARLVQQYLSRILGNEYHWVTVGYGQSQPLVDNTTPANRQRNRRVEIAIDP